MDYSSFKPEDFSRDPSFQKWVLTDDRKAAEFWESWLKQNPEKYDDIVRAQELIRLLGFQKNYTANEDYLEVWGGIQQHTNEELITKPEGSFLKPVLKVAAVFGAIAIISALAYLLLGSGQMVTYATEFGKIRSITLPDGSTATLNANSTLRTSEKWDSHQPREVWLEGEAFFNVQEVFKNLNTERDSSSGLPVKFIVHAGLLEVEVLGTQFNVNNRHKETSVVLKSGKVKLNVKAREKTEEIFMEPGEMVAFNEMNYALTKRIVNPDAYASWIDHKLVFEEATLREVARTLEDLYGVKIVFEEDGLAEERFTGSVPYDDIQIVLEAFIKLYDIAVIKKQDSIIFHKK